MFIFITLFSFLGTTLKESFHHHLRGTETLKFIFCTVTLIMTMLIVVIQCILYKRVWQQFSWNVFRRVGTSKELIQAFTNREKFKAYAKLNITCMILNLLNWIFYMGHHNFWNQLLMIFAYIIQIIFSFWAILALKYESKTYMRIYIVLITISIIVVPCIMIEEYQDNNWEVFDKLGYD